MRRCEACGSDDGLEYQMISSSSRSIAQYRRLEKISLGERGARNFVRHPENGSLLLLAVFMKSGNQD
jgi:hypothetical protein